MMEYGVHIIFTALVERIVHHQLSERRKNMMKSKLKFLKNYLSEDIEIFVICWFNLLSNYVN